jgi:hypothetical protein
LKILFLDESGDHNLIKIDNQYPIFVLGGIIVDEQYLPILNEKVDEFKIDMFGTKDIILHTADISRNKNGFENLKDSAFRSKFLNKMNILMDELQYDIIACVIKKDEHIKKYSQSAIDPYILSLNILVEQFYINLKQSKQDGYIVAEKRNRILDNELELAWLSLKIKGTKHIKGSEIDQYIENLRLENKNLNTNALQLADLIVSPIGRYILGKTIRKDFDIIKSKFLKYTDDNKLGIIVLPKK